MLKILANQLDDQRTMKQDETTPTFPDRRAELTKGIQCTLSSAVVRDVSGFTVLLTYKMQSNVAN